MCPEVIPGSSEYCTFFLFLHIFFLFLYIFLEFWTFFSGNFGQYRHSPHNCDILTVRSIISKVTLSVRSLSLTHEFAPTSVTILLLKDDLSTKATLLTSAPMYATSKKTAKLFLLHHGMQTDYTTSTSIHQRTQYTWQPSHHLPLKLTAPPLLVSSTLTATSSPIKRRPVCTAVRSITPTFFFFFLLTKNEHPRNRGVMYTLSMRQWIPPMG